MDALGREVAVWTAVQTAVAWDAVQTVVTASVGAVGMTLQALLQDPIPIPRPMAGVALSAEAVTRGRATAAGAATAVTARSEAKR